MMSTSELPAQVQVDFDRFFDSYDGSIPTDDDRYRDSDRYREMRIAFCVGMLSRQDPEAFGRFVKSLEVVEVVNVDQSI